MPEVSGLAIGGLIAAAALLYPFWNRITAFVKSFQFLIFREDYVAYDVTETVRTYLYHHHGKSWLAKKNYEYGYGYIRSTGRGDIFSQRYLADEVVRIWLRRWPIPTFVHFTDNNIVTIRGTVDVDALVGKAYAWRRSLNDRRKADSRYKVCRVGYFRSRMSGGSSSKMKASGGTSTAADEPEGDSGSNKADIEEEKSDNVQTPWIKMKYQPVGLTWEDVQPPDRNDMETLAVTEDHTALVDEIRFLLRHRTWFEERSLPWRRGYLLHGPPGNGKTKMVRALGQHFGLPVYLFDLASLTNDALDEAWKEIRSEQPLIAVFEDIDAIYDGRHNVTRETSFWGNGVTFDAFLNTLDGADLQDGIISIVTTNRPEALDAALAKQMSDGTMKVRPGRIDRDVYFGPPNTEGRRKIITRVMRDMGGDLIDDLVRATDGKTGAEVQEAATLAALAEFWRAAECGELVEKSA